MKLTVALHRKLEKQVLKGEISYSRMIEILNETFVEKEYITVNEPLPSDDELLEIYDKHSSIIAHWDGALVTMSLQQFIDAVKSLSLSQPQKEESLTTADHLNATLLEKVGIIADKNVKIKELEAQIKELQGKLKEVCVGFGDWINKNRFSKYFGNEGENVDKWYIQYSKPGREYYTTDELFDLYLQSESYKSIINP